MSNIKLKNMPRLTLADVLRRRKSNLVNFVKESGVQSYEGLVILCNRLGMLPPTEKIYKSEVNPPLVSSQQDGIVVMEPAPEPKPVPESKKETKTEPVEETETKAKRRKKQKKQQVEEVVSQLSGSKEE